MDRLVRIFRPAAFDSLMAAFDGSHQDLLGGGGWRGLRRKGESASASPDIAALRGPSAVYQEPKVVVGTIHSVKGGQADVVYLFPDLSRSGDAAYYRGGADHDSVIRLFYVAVTRAREVLYVCQRETAMSICL